MAEAPVAAIGTNRRTLVKVLQSSAMSTAVSAVAGFFVLPLVLHGIGATKYGEWATLAAVLAIGQLAGGGVATEISRRVATAYGGGHIRTARQSAREGTTVLFFIAALVELAGLVVAHPVINLVFRTVPAGQRGRLVLLLIGVVTLVAVRLVSSGYFGILTGLQRADYANWSLIAGLVASAAVTVAGISVGLGLWALLLADTMQLLVGCVGPLIGMRRHVPKMRFRLVKVSTAVALGFIGMPAMIVVSSAGDLFDSQVDKLVLTHVVGPAASAMFQIGAQLALSGIGVALLPLSFLLVGTAELHRTDPVRLRRLESLADCSTQAIGTVTAGGFLVFAVPFLRVWLGPGYGGGALSLQLLAIAALLNIWSAPWSYYAIGRGRYDYVLMSDGTNLVVNAASTIFLTTHIGLLGALIGSIAGNASGTLVGWLVLRRWEKRQWFRPAFRAAFAVAPVVGLLFAARHWIPASWIALFGWGLLYLVGCVIMLLVTRSLPFTIALRGRGLPQLSWREDRTASRGAP